MITKSGSIFDIKDGEVHLKKGALSLCKELKNLDEDLVKYLILVYDQYDSPYWKKPLHERQLNAKRSIWKNDTEQPEKKITKKQIAAIISLNYSSRVDTIQVYTNKISILQRQLSDQDDHMTIQKISETIKKLEDLKVKEEQSFLNEKSQGVELKGDKRLTWIETKQRSIEAYRQNRAAKARTNTVGK